MIGLVVTPQNEMHERLLCPLEFFLLIYLVVILNLQLNFEFKPILTYGIQQIVLTENAK